MSDTVKAAAPSELTEPPEAPIWLDNNEANAWQQGWLSGHTARAALSTESPQEAPPAPSGEPDYWPSAKVIVHEDEERYGVHRVTATLYAPGLPPGEYDLYLPASPTEKGKE